jgi:hypothetical protein
MEQRNVFYRDELVDAANRLRDAISQKGYRMVNLAEQFGFNNTILSKKDRPIGISIDALAPLIRFISPGTTIHQFLYKFDRPMPQLYQLDAIRQIYENATDDERTRATDISYNRNYTEPKPSEVLKRRLSLLYKTVPSSEMVMQGNNGLDMTLRQIVQGEKDTEGTRISTVMMFADRFNLPVDFLLCHDFSYLPEYSGWFKDWLHTFLVANQEGAMVANLLTSDEELTVNQSTAKFEGIGWDI